MASLSSLIGIPMVDVMLGGLMFELVVWCLRYELFDKSRKAEAWTSTYARDASKV